MANDTQTAKAGAAKAATQTTGQAPVNPNPAIAPIQTIVARTEFGPRLLPSVANLNSWKGDPTKDKRDVKTKGDYDKKALGELGLRTEHTVVIPYFEREDFLSGDAIGKAFERVRAELDKAQDLWDKALAAVPDADKSRVQVIVEATNEDGSKRHAILANPRDIFPSNGNRPGTDVAYKMSDLLFESAVSGTNLAFQGEHGKRMRDEAEDKLGKAGKKSSGRGGKADAGF